MKIQFNWFHLLLKITNIIGLIDRLNYLHKKKLHSILFFFFFTDVLLNLSQLSVYEKKTLLSTVWKQWYISWFDSYSSLKGPVYMKIEFG